MSGYKVIGHRPLRSFKIVCSLVPGYGDERLNERQAMEHFNKAILEHGRWIRDRITSNQSYLTGLFAMEMLSYGYQIQDEVKLHREPCLVFQGDASPLYHNHLSNAEVEGMLTELGRIFGTLLGQTRVYLSHAQTAWVLEKEDA